MASSLINAFRNQVRRASFMATTINNGRKRIVNLENMAVIELKGKTLIFHKHNTSIFSDSRYFNINYETANGAEKDYNRILKFLESKNDLLDVDKPLEIEGKIKN